MRAIAGLINDAGWAIGRVVSRSAPEGTAPVGGFVWHRGVTRIAGAPAPLTYYGLLDVNAWGQAVMLAETPAGVVRSLLWDDGETTDLGSLGGLGARTEGTDVNDRDEVVGSSTTAAGVSQRSSGQTCASPTSRPHPPMPTSRERRRS